MDEEWSKCPKCGTKYYLKKVKYPIKDIAHEIQCPICNTTICRVNKGTDDYNVITEEQYKRNMDYEKSRPVCPQCGSKMKLRSGQYGTFWGCSNYPKCRYTKDYEK
ncbi:topoisomerase DNA-binding C4 zinc finger domain-containing protein [Clostridium hydrogenum]|uniref:topoisomerase DNA-binding C4 zinc finger domain-containing protein n=1 Tax=Clostridium hydrogenum TaxID=2855764 RepID=UPI001F1BA768|nr:topoisomerase DNA-binding C4 zinc finger domain-containing protein [Clostridium hydrogenum]